MSFKSENTEENARKAARYLDNLYKKNGPCNSITGPFKRFKRACQKFNLSQNFMREWLKSNNA